MNKLLFPNLRTSTKISMGCFLVLAGAGGFLAIKALQAPSPICFGIAFVAMFPLVTASDLWFRWVLPRIFLDAHIAARAAGFEERFAAELQPVLRIGSEFGASARHLGWHGIARAFAAATNA